MKELNITVVHRDQGTKKVVFRTSGWIESPREIMGRRDVSCLLKDTVVVQERIGNFTLGA